MVTKISVVAWYTLLILTTVSARDGFLSLYNLTSCLLNYLFKARERDSERESKEEGEFRARDFKFPNMQHNDARKTVYWHFWSGVPLCVISPTKITLWHAVQDGYMGDGCAFNGCFAKIGQTVVLQTWHIDMGIWFRDGMQSFNDCSAFILLNPDILLHSW